MCEKYNSSAVKCIDSFNKNRSFFMGVSMLAVLLFHAYIAWGGLFIFKYPIPKIPTNKTIRIVDTIIFLITRITLPSLHYR